MLKMLILLWVFFFVGWFGGTGNMGLGVCGDIFELDAVVQPSS